MKITYVEIERDSPVAKGLRILASMIARDYLARSNDHNGAAEHGEADGVVNQSRAEKPKDKLTMEVRNGTGRPSAV